MIIVDIDFMIYGQTKSRHQQEDCMMTLIMICLHDLPTRRSPEDVEEADAGDKENAAELKSVDHLKCYKNSYTI